MTRSLLPIAFGLLLTTAPAAAQDLAGAPGGGQQVATTDRAESRPGNIGPLFQTPSADLAIGDYLTRPKPRGRRPAALPALYATLAGFNALDAYTTVRALNAGAHEANPLVVPAAGHLGASLAVKAVSTATSIYLSESLWKKNRAAAIVTMIAVNGVTAAIAARNFRNAR